MCLFAGERTPVVSTACYVDVTGDLLTSLAGLQHRISNEQQMSVQSVQGVQEPPMTLKQLVAETVSDQNYSQTIEQPVNGKLVHEEKFLKKFIVNIMNPVKK